MTGYFCLLFTTAAATDRLSVVSLELGHTHACMLTHARTHTYDLNSHISANKGTVFKVFKLLLDATYAKRVPAKEWLPHWRK